MGGPGIVPGHAPTEYYPARTFTALESDVAGHAAIRRSVRNIKTAIGGGFLAHAPGAIIKLELAECVVCFTLHAL